MRAAGARFAALTGRKLTGFERGADVTHVLSHRRLEIVVLHAEVGGAGAGSAPVEAEYVRFELLPPERLSERGVSTLARKILASRR